MRLPGSLLMAACLATSLPACGASRAPSSLAQHAAGAPPAKGISNVRLIVEPRDGVRPVVRDINLAQTKIFVAVYILTDRSVVHALDRAAAQGVDVYVLLEHHPFGMGSQPGAMAASLRAAGIHVRWSAEGFTYAHAKYLILDDREALIGTANLSASAFSHNREFVAVDVRTPDVRAVSNLFRSDWDRLPAVINDPELVAAPGQARAQIEGLAASARRTIDIYAEEVADPGMERELISIARRGVQIRVLLPPGAVSVGARWA